MPRALRAAALSFLVLGVAACAPGRLETTWVEPGRTPSPVKDVLVLGVAAQETVRRAYEDSFVAALRARGVKARPGHSLLPEGELADANTVRRAVRSSGADAVLITHLVGVTAETTQVPARNYVTVSLYGGLYPYYGLVYDNVTEPGYYARFRLLAFETNLYDTERERLVWSGRSQTLDPSSEQTTISEVIAKVTDALAAAGFVPRATTAPRSAAPSPVLP
jgi:hypothetical protein